MNAQTSLAAPLLTVSAPWSACEPRSQDEVWLVSSRTLGSQNGSVDALGVRLRINGQWEPSSVRSLLAATAEGRDVPTVIFVHGNRCSLDKTIRQGLQTFERTFLAWREAPTMRFVIWAWPSDPIRGLIRDVRIKAARADEHSVHLARFLQQMPSASKVSLIGYSYGGRLTLGALHLLGGGHVAGMVLPQSNAPHTRRVNVTLVVPAIRNDALQTTRSRAYSQIDHLYLLYNSRDAYLGLFKFTRFSDHHPALGYTGICGLNQLSDHAFRIEQFNAAHAVGRDHDYVEYITDRQAEQSIRRNLFSGFDH